MATNDTFDLGPKYEGLASGDEVRWDDLRFPLTGRNIDINSGRLDFDFYNGTVTFASNARGLDIRETISFTVQLPHSWLEESTIRPHIHWLQQDASDLPNWLLGYKFCKKGETLAALETDFTNHTLVIPSNHVFTYSANVLEQITTFPDISMRDVTISDNIHFCLWRDTANASSLFSGADPSSIAEHVREFDIHYIVDGKGSQQEFLKQDWGK